MKEKKVDFIPSMKKTLQCEMKFLSDPNYETRKE